MKLRRLGLLLVGILPLSFAEGSCLDKVEPTSDWIMNQVAISTYSILPKKTTVEHFISGDTLVKRETYNFLDNRISQYIAYQNNKKINIIYNQSNGILEGRGRATKIEGYFGDITPEIIIQLDGKERTNGDFRKVFINNKNNGFIFNASSIDEETLDFRENNQNMEFTYKMFDRITNLSNNFDKECKILTQYSKNEYRSSNIEIKYIEKANEGKIEFDMFRNSKKVSAGVLEKNEDGRIKSATYKSANGLNVTLYKYDERGNWVEILTLDNGEEESRIVRTIEYN